MNLRSLTLRYMGWCPGVESAARFLPDRDVPPTRIAFAALIVTSISASSYLLSYQAFTVLGITRPSGVEAVNYDPKLAFYGGQTYIVLNVVTHFIQPLSGRPIYQSSSIYKAMLSFDGSIEDKEKIIDLGDANLGPWDFLISGDGRWYIAYTYYGSGEFSKFDPNLYFIRSTDGRDWSEPATVAKKAGRYASFYPSLSETANGEIFLLFTNDNYNWYYSIYDETVWSPMKEGPMHAEEQTAFLDEDGRMAIIGDDYDRRGDVPGTERYVITEFGILIARDRGSGNWTEPRCLTDLSAPLRGYKARMFYSERHEGYFLTMNYPDSGMGRALCVYFTKDLEDWELRTYFIDAWEGSLIELPNGTLALVYLKIEHEPYSTDIYLTTSAEGVSWTPPKKLELIVDEEALRNIPPVQVSNSSIVVSLVATVSVLIILHRRPSLVLGKASMKESAG